MKRMFRLLENVKDYNTFREVEQFEHQNGTQQDVYIRLVQKESDAEPGDVNLRWLPSNAAATVTFKFDSIDSGMAISRAGTMSFPNDDRSIFKVTLLSTDIISGSLTIVFTDNGVTETLLLDGRLIASSADSSRFFC